MTATHATATSRESPYAAKDRRMREERELEVLALFSGDPIPLKPVGLPAFPLHALPETYLQMAAAVAASVQVDTAMVGPMILGALSAAVGGCVETEVRPGWVETSVLHFVVSASPSERKSAAMRQVMAPLYAAEKALAASVGPIRQAALVRKRVADQKAVAAEKEAAKSTAKSSAGSTDPMVGGVDHVALAVKLAAEAEAITVPEIPRILADDVTPEAMVRRMMENRGRLAVVSAEGGAFDTLAGRYSRGVANTDVWLKAYSGDPIRVDRVNRDSETIDRPALTVCVATQPDKLATVMGDTRFADSGLLSRLCVAQPRSMVGHRDPDDAMPVPESVAYAYAEALTGLAAALHDPEHGPVAKMVKFHPAASAEVMEIERTVERRLRVGGDLGGSMAEWGGKHVGRVVRLAVLLHMAENGPEGTGVPVSLDSVRAAREIGEFFTAHTTAAAGVISTGDAKLSELIAAFEWLRERERALPFNPVYLRGKSGPMALRHKSTRDPLLDVLADYNLVVKAKDGRKTVIYVHPDAADARWSVS